MLITLRKKVNLQRFVLSEATLTVTALHVHLRNYQTMIRRFVKPVLKLINNSLRKYKGN